MPFFRYYFNYLYKLYKKYYMTIFTIYFVMIFSIVDKLSCKYILNLLYTFLYK